ncbi:tetratricopeptide repeat-containing sensor histidine kinase [Tenacibaculum ovolyticum]|uniref:tetratricopeptide repeat-containing sensor histidine kinase n=1 Tax=Tenacibaculum ovolyticum TaxID=104270 RepID=UPI00040CE602|nr:tetratricopeptide repeat protein [Tenacibaculum ovolyticum]
MKTFLIAIVSLIITGTCFSQKNVDSLIINALENKELDYYKLQKYFKRNQFTDKQINLLLVNSGKNEYYLGEIFAKNLKGRLLRKSKEYDIAVDLYREALALSIKAKSKEAEVVTLNQLGIIYQRQDKIRMALNYHQSALSIISKIEDPSDSFKISKIISINSLGNIYLSLKQYERALNKFNESIAIQLELNHVKGLAINNQNIGFAYKNIGYLDLALGSYQKALRYNTVNKDKLGEVICHNNISDILIKKGRYEDAYKSIIKVVDIAEKIGSNYHLSETYNTLGLVFLKMNKLEESQIYLEKSLEIGLEKNTSLSLGRSYSYMSELYIKKEDYNKALIFYKKSIEIEKKAFTNKNIRYVNSLISVYDTEVISNKIKNLARENEIAKLKLTRNRNILIIALISIALFGVLLYSVYRQRLLKNDKQILLLEQEALRIQMNPHFVFNALNSIKLYIINNEQKNAVHYLNKFSKLIRNILESTTVKEVTLAEELKTMNLYMSIENIRFSNEISYREILDENLSSETIKVPPLILQPFLENSIWHGLSSKKGEKKVQLSVNKISDEFIQINIEDNGIGRKQAFIIKSNKSLNRKSIGIDLTKERLKNFSTQFQNNYSLVYTDLVDESGDVEGTRVSLKIPII